MPKRRSSKAVEPLTHGEASRKNIPTAEFRSVMDRSEQSPVRVAYERRNRDLDPQLVWRGKDEQDWSDLVVQVPPLYIQEKVHPKALVDDLRHRTEDRRRDREDAAGETQPDLFADFNGLPDDGAKTEFYQHDATLKAEIDPDAWATLNSDISRPFDRPESGRIAVKVINHLGDEVMKVFRV